MKRNNALYKKAIWGDLKSAVLTALLIAVVIGTVVVFIILTLRGSTETISKHLDLDKARIPQHLSDEAQEILDGPDDDDFRFAYERCIGVPKEGRTFNEEVDSDDDGLPDDCDAVHNPADLRDKKRFFKKKVDLNEKFKLECETKYPKGMAVWDSTGNGKCCVGSTDIQEHYCPNAVS